MSREVARAERDALVEDLTSSDEELRHLALARIASWPREAAEGHWLSALGDESWRVRKAAAEQLGLRGDSESVREGLIAALADGENPGRRNAAFEALVACGPLVTSRLVAALEDPDVDVRKLVVDVLAGLGDPAARVPLCDALGDADPNVRGAACEALAVCGGAAEAERMLVVARDDAEELLVRLSALRALAAIGFPVGVAALGSALESKPLRPAVLELLGASMDDQATPVLLKALADPSPSARDAAARGLMGRMARVDGGAATALEREIRSVFRSEETLVERLGERLESAPLSLRLALVPLLGFADDPRAARHLLAVGRDEALAELAEAALVSLGEAAAVELEARWPSLGFDQRMRACGVLARIRGPRAERLLVDALASEDFALRCRAARAIGEGGFAECLPTLVERLERAARCDEPDEQEEVAAIVDGLVALAGHAATRASGFEVRLVAALSSRLGGAPRSVRWAIARVLARVGSDRDDDLLGLLLKDEAEEVRRAAVDALGRLSFDRARDALRLALVDESVRVRIGAAELLGASGRREAREPLVGLVDDGDPRVAAAAIRALARTLRDGVVDLSALEAVLKRVLDGDALPALAAAELLAAVGGPRAARWAGRLLDRDEPQVLRVAVGCIGCHGDDDDVRRLHALIVHPDWAVREAVVQAFVARDDPAALPVLRRQLECESDAFVRESIRSAITRFEG
ncbi:MAG: HEAT repeat domain-containing protein [Spirochaetaceae bacterium]|nr:HEAT repeat domain-containing protein [Spirochaetaceae bacterium]